MNSAAKVTATGPLTPVNRSCQAGVNGCVSSS